MHMILVLHPLCLSLIQLMWFVVIILVIMSKIEFHNEQQKEILKYHSIEIGGFKSIINKTCFVWFGIQQVSMSSYSNSYQHILEKKEGYLGVLS